METTWNSLEIVKVIISCITPIIGGIIAWRLARIGKDIENRQWTNRKIIEKRLEIYEKLVPDLNDLYCFYLRIGNWKEISPEKVIALKRKLDKNFNIYNHLFQWDILSEYNEFIHLCFETYTGPGKTAKIKSSFENREKYIKDWDSKWNESFMPEKESDHKKIKTSYDRLIKIFRKELDLGVKA